MQSLLKLFKQSLFNKTSLIALACLLPVHICFVKISAIFAFEDGTGIIWPSSGLFLATMLILGPKRIAVPAFICDFVGNEFLWYHHLPVSTTVSLMANLDYLVASVLILRIIKRPYPFNRISDTLKYYFFLLPGTVITSAIAIAAQCAFGVSEWSNFFFLYQSWLTSVVTAMAIVSPVVLCLWQAIKEGSWRLSISELIELLAVVATLLITGLTAFAGAAPVEYVLILPLIWSAIRFGPKESSLLSFIVSAIAIFKTLSGHGSFYAQDNILTTAVLLQSFVVSLTVATLILAAAIQENRKANHNLRRANDDLEHRVEARTVELSDALRTLKKTQSQLVQQEKMSSLGQMVAGVAHEINNPVNFIHGNVKYLGNYIGDLTSFLKLYETYYPNPVEEIQEEAEDLDIDFIKEDIAKTLSAMKVGTERIREIVLSLRNFSRMDEAESKAVDIHEGIDSTLMILQHRLKAKSERPAIEVVKDYDPLPKVECYAGQLNQVFMNILTNSIDALEDELEKNPDSQESLKITIRTEGRADSVVISIADNGVGIPEDVKARIFDPFFTTKEVGQGTGMGMAISYQLVVDTHKGKIDCFSDKGVGTEFVIEIPIHLPASS